jgi:TusA-related sulfurtransferase
MKEQNLIKIDCRKMEHPGPLVAVLSAINTLNENQKIIMIHRMIPNLLFPKLAELKIDYKVLEINLEEEKCYQIEMWRATDV